MFVCRKCGIPLQFLSAKSAGDLCLRVEEVENSNGNCACAEVSSVVLSCLEISTAHL